MTTVPEPRGSADAFLAGLRPRLVEVARRRVAADDVEDVVQTALEVIHRRGPEAGQLVDGRPALAWCLQVLRNVIGNHYERSRTRRRVLDASVEVERLSVPLEGQDEWERRRAITGALEELGGDCEQFLRRLGEGHSAAELAEEAGLAAHALYQRLYRCRRRFREILRSRGVLT